MSTDEKKSRIISTAAKLIGEDILNILISRTMYPSSNHVATLDYNTSFLSKSLLEFLKVLFDEQNSSLRLVAIGQAIIQACRPKKIIAPLQLGLGLQMHHQFGFRILIYTLSAL